MTALEEFDFFGKLVTNFHATATTQFNALVLLSILDNYELYKDSKCIKNLMSRK